MEHAFSLCMNTCLAKISWKCAATLNNTLIFISCKINVLELTHLHIISKRFLHSLVFLIIFLTEQNEEFAGILCIMCLEYSFLLFFKKSCSHHGDHFEQKVMSISFNQSKLFIFLKIAENGTQILCIIWIRTSLLIYTTQTNLKPLSLGPFFIRSRKSVVIFSFQDD